MISTPQLFSAYFAKLLATSFKDVGFKTWTVVNDISQTRDTQENYIYCHAGESDAVAGVPIGNRTYRTPILVVARWYEESYIINMEGLYGGEISTIQQVVRAACDQVRGQDIQAASYDTEVGCHCIEAYPGAPVVNTDGVFYEMQLQVDFILQF